MIPKLNRKKDSLSLMIESKIDPWEIFRSKESLKRCQKEKKGRSYFGVISNRKASSCLTTLDVF